MIKSNEKIKIGDEVYSYFKKFESKGYQISFKLFIQDPFYSNLLIPHLYIARQNPNRMYFKRIIPDGCDITREYWIHINLEWLRSGVRIILIKYKKTPIQLCSTTIKQWK